MVCGKTRAVTAERWVGDRMAGVCRKCADKEPPEPAAPRHRAG